MINNEVLSNKYFDTVQSIRTIMMYLLHHRVVVVVGQTIGSTDSVKPL